MKDRQIDRHRHSEETEHRQKDRHKWVRAQCLCSSGGLGATTQAKRCAVRDRGSKRETARDGCIGLSFSCDLNM